MQPKTKYARSMEALDCMEAFERINATLLERIHATLSCIDAIIFLPSGIPAAGQMIRRDIGEVIDKLEPFRDGLGAFAWELRQASPGTVDKAQLSTFKGLVKICLRGLIALEKSLVLLMEKIEAPFDVKNFASWYWSIPDESESMVSTQASPLPPKGKSKLSSGKSGEKWL